MATVAWQRSTTTTKTNTTDVATATVTMTSTARAKPGHTVFQEERLTKVYHIVETATGPFALHALQQLPRPTAPVHMLDLACGTAVATRHAQSMLETLSQDTPSILSASSFVLADSSAQMLKAAATTAHQHGWLNYTTRECDMMHLPFPDESFTHVLCTFGPAICAQPARCLAECYRVLRPQGHVAFTFWSTVGWHPDVISGFDHIRSSASQAVAAGTATPDQHKLQHLPPAPTNAGLINAFNARHDPTGAHWHEKSHIETQMQRAGFQNVQITKHRRTSVYTPDQVGVVMAPMIGLFKNTVWDEATLKQLGDVDVGKAFSDWISRKYDGVEEVVWDDWSAWVVTGEK